MCKASISSRELTTASHIYITTKSSRCIKEKSRVRLEGRLKISGSLINCCSNERAIGYTALIPQCHTHPPRPRGDDYSNSPRFSPSPRYYGCPHSPPRIRQPPTTSSRPCPAHPPPSSKCTPATSKYSPHITAPSSSGSTKTATLPTANAPSSGSTADRDVVPWTAR